jgi:hypothetical protein
LERVEIMAYSTVLYDVGKEKKLYNDVQVWKVFETDPQSLQLF